MVECISVLGSTGSIGVQTLEVAKHLGINVVALSAGGNIERLYEQTVEFRPSVISVNDKEKAAVLAENIKSAGLKTEVLWGNDGNCSVAKASGADMVVAAIVGIAGLMPVMCAIKEKKDIALANKETLVAAGEIVMEEAGKNNIKIYPVDSEHSAIWQCLKDFDTEGVSRIFLTASGGPFRGKTRDEVSNVRVEDALAHPTWDMGGKITIDSATLMNKGLEVVEAVRLFGVDKSDIEVVVHPQSIIHSMVEFSDGSVMAQMGFPDMKVPIQLALTRKTRVKGLTRPFDPFSTGDLTFERPDTDTFRCLSLAYNALEIGGSMTAVMNSANEKAVELFLKRKISFTDIDYVIEKTMDAHMKEIVPKPSIENVLELDKWANNFVSHVKTRSG